MFFTAYVLCSRRLTKLKLGKQYKQNTSPKKKQKKKEKKTEKKKLKSKFSLILTQLNRALGNQVLAVELLLKDQFRYIKIQP